MFHRTWSANPITAPSPLVLSLSAAVLGANIRLTIPEIRSFFSSEDEFFSYFDASSVASCRKALDDLDAYIAAEGPFDGVMAFSQGAALAATLIVRKFRQDSEGQRTNPVFKCALFISGGLPCDPYALMQDELRLLSHDVDREPILVPTAHIWGAHDLSFPGSSAELSRLCWPQGRTEFIHEGGHEVPGFGSKEAVIGSVHAIRRAIDKALLIKTP